MEQNLRQAINDVEDFLKHQDELISTGLLPRIMENGIIELKSAITLIVNYVKDTETLKELK